MSAILHPLIQTLGQGNGSMLTAGTSDTDNELVFTLLDVVRDQEIEEIHHLVYEFARLGKTHNVLSDFLVQTRLGLELIYIERVGQETHIEYQIRVLRYTVFEAEGQY